MTDKPYHTQYWNNEGTQLQYQHWMKSGYKYHRIGGPARVWYNEQGEVTYEEYYIDGQYPEGYEEWCTENEIYMPITMEQRVALKLRWA